MNKDDLIRFMEWLENVFNSDNSVLKFNDKEVLAQGFLDSEGYKEFKRRQPHGTRRPARKGK